eukprot:TRINITY_DN12230_c0_g1_i8.p1 TRINITY_DN12230_c0_g1~~TRINITY_DN12230_c0_g1_i8.p1  ORF type:complete len:400 (-),score=63.50 TRINITY_DN12230_c0_g1_i8:195-1394(-)
MCIRDRVKGILTAARDYSGDLANVVGPEIKLAVLDSGLQGATPLLMALDELRLTKIEHALNIFAGLGSEEQILHDSELGGYEKDLLGPYRYICEEGGKEIRSKFIKAFNVWLKIPEEKCMTIRRVTQGLHNASLLIDDIQDNSRLRRGRPCAHLVYGVAHTINCANHVYFLALQEVIDLGNPEAISVFTKELIELHRGQGMDIWWRDGSHQRAPSVEEYNMMVKLKTGGLFRLSLGLMAAFSENKTDLVPLLNDLAVFFQILDDLLNLSSEEYHANKSFAEDLTEGKFSFPIVWAISKDGDNRILSMLRQRTEDDDMKRYFITYLNELGAMDHTRSVISDLKTGIMSQIADLGGNQGLVDIVEYLHEKMTQCTTDSQTPGSAPIDLESRVCRSMSDMSL